MAHALKKIAIAVLVACVAIMTLLAILSVWDVLQRDVLGKSLSTIGIVAFSSLIVLIAAKYAESHIDKSGQQ